MNLIRQSHVIEAITPNALELIERAGRTCYKSEDKICEGSAERFVLMLIGRHHESVLEHASITVRFVTNRGVSHEAVRHRLASPSQESTRYVNYDKRGMSFILPVWVDDFQIDTGGNNVHEMLYCSNDPLDVFFGTLLTIEHAYSRLIQLGWTPEKAREVLPNALKTELVITANFREWRHILRERTSRAAHPQIRALMLPLLRELQDGPCGVAFADIGGDAK